MANHIPALFAALGSPVQHAVMALAAAQNGRAAAIGAAVARAVAPSSLAALVDADTFRTAAATGGRLTPPLPALAVLAPTLATVLSHE